MGNNKLEYIKYKLSKNNLNDFYLLRDILHLYIENKEIQSFRLKNSINNTVPKTIFTIEDVEGFELVFENNDSKTEIFKFNPNPNTNLHPNTNLQNITLDKFSTLIKNHINGIDHTGIVIFENNMKYELFNNKIKKITKNCNLYKYPNEKKWSFILPSTYKEIENEIVNFTQVRAPKFEFVFVKDKGNITIQIDIHTNLNKIELEKLFPHPIGIVFEGLEEYFRSVFIYSQLPFILRFDLRYKEKNIINDWNTGKYLVCK